MRLLAAVDWDGTAVTDAWPAMGTWNAGAIENIRKLTKLGRIAIHTCRIAPTDYDGVTLRPEAVTQMEINGIREMLDAEGLHEVVIWQKPWKPPAEFYIDNKGVHYNGRKGAWDAIYTRVAAMCGKEIE